METNNFQARSYTEVNVRGNSDNKTEISCPNCYTRRYLTRINKQHCGIIVSGWRCLRCKEEFADLSEIENFDRRKHGRG